MVCDPKYIKMIIQCVPVSSLDIKENCGQSDVSSYSIVQLNCGICIVISWLTRSCDMETFPS